MATDLSIPPSPYTPPPSRGAGTLIVLAAVLAFVDESVRKVLPGQPVMITVVKDVLLAWAGLLVFLRFRGWVGGYVGAFLPWCVVTLLSSVYVTLAYGAYLAPPAVGRTYVVAPLLFFCGYTLAFDSVTRGRVGRILMFGTLTAMLVAVLQEYARPMLPDFLALRITKEQHSLAGGGYNEGLFASPQTLSAVVMVFLTWAVSGALFAHVGTSMRTGLAALGAGFVLLLVRIRVAVPLALLSAMTVVMLSGRSGVGFQRLFPRLVVGTIGALVLIGLAALTVAAPDPFDPSSAQDVNFFLYLLDPQEWVGRFLLVFREIQDLVYHNPLVGYGAGTGGIVRSIIATPAMVAIPIVKDTGLYLLYHEMGLVGVVVFLISYGGLVARALVRIWRQPHVPVAALPAFATALALTLWFLLKSHTIMSNGLTHAIWLGSLGFCFGALDASRYALMAWSAQQEQAPQPLAA